MHWIDIISIKNFDTFSYVCLKHRHIESYVRQNFTINTKNRWRSVLCSFKSTMNFKMLYETNRMWPIFFYSVHQAECCISYTSEESCEYSFDRTGDENVTRSSSLRNMIAQLSFLSCNQQNSVWYSILFDEKITTLRIPFEYNQ